jgi:MFS family permease
LGISYYAFPVSSVSIIRDTGWSAPVITAAFSVGQLATALTGIPVGRVLDRITPRLVMTAGSVVAVVALPVVAVAPNLRLGTDLDGTLIAYRRTGDHHYIVADPAEGLFPYLDTHAYC